MTPELVEQLAKPLFQVLHGYFFGMGFLLAAYSAWQFPGVKRRVIHAIRLIRIRSTPEEEKAILDKDGIKS